MAKPKSKTVAMSVTVRVPAWMTAAQARLEVRTLVNDQANYLSYGPEYEEFSGKATKVAPGAGS